MEDLGPSERAFAILGDTLAAEDEALGHLPEGGELRATLETG
jgi:hypothetical protein